MPVATTAMVILRRIGGDHVRTGPHYYVGVTTLAPGDTFAGYTIERQLGAGGMGEVYLVRHPRLPRHDALKVLGPQLSGDPQFRARFEREADVVAGLAHPNIVTVYDRGEADGRLWITFAYIDGTDLDHLSANGPLPAEQAVRIIGEIADALDEAGSHGLVHRDVKPANILISTNGRALLTDFGIAHAGGGNTALTGTGMTMGTIAFASPEQLQAYPVDPRSDQYSLACTAFTILTGSIPYIGDSPTAVILAHVRDPIPNASHRNTRLPQAVDQVFARAMAKEPAHRFPDSRSFAAALAAALGNAPAPYPAGRPPTAPQPVPAPTAIPFGPLAGSPYPPAYAPTQHRPAPAPFGHPPAPPTPPPARRSRKTLLIGIATAVVLVVVAGLLVGRLLRGDDPKVSAEATGLTRTPVSADLGSLEHKPARALWQWTPGARSNYTPQLSGIIGGTDDFALMGVIGTSDPKIAIVNATNGKTLRTANLSASIEYVRRCVPFSKQLHVVCAVSAAGRSGNTNDATVIVDLQKATATTPTQGTLLAVTGDTFVTYDEGLQKMFGHTMSGRQTWSVTADRSITENVIDGSPVVPSTDGNTWSLVSMSTGRPVYTRDRSRELGTDRTTDIAWTPFHDGFAVAETQSGSDKVSTALFNGSGARTAQVDGWTPLALDVYGAHRGPAPSLPILAKGKSVGVANPATGTVLWRISGADHHSSTKVISGFGTKAIVLERSSMRWFDLYNGKGGFLPDDNGTVALGTDGTRVAITDLPGKHVTVYDTDGPLWTQPTNDQEVVSAGGKLYVGTQRIL